MQYWSRHNTSEDYYICVQSNGCVWIFTIGLWLWNYYYASFLPLHWFSWPRSRSLVQL